ncbi:MAG: DUF1840 domain-containing protein [Burkholderiales bacterium]|jgi:hypothetical protein
MLVKFQSDVGSLTMFDDVAKPLLKLMGHTGTIPSAILPEDIPAALARLRAAVAVDPGSPGPAEDKHSDQDKGEIPVSLRQRAFPLIELLERAAKEECEVVWR